MDTARPARHRFLQKIFWSSPGVAVVKGYQAFSRGWQYAVMNRSLLSESNGEHWLLGILPAAPLIVDVGFNRGDFSREALRQRPRARVVGFDPAESMQEAFAADFAGESRVELVPLALSNERSKLEFHDSSDGRSSLAEDATAGARTYVVEAVRLDDFAEERGWPAIDLLKIDAEGFDLHVLEGAERLLARGAVDVFTFEYNWPWILSRRFLRDACAYLEDKPYDLFRLFNGFLAPFRYTHRAERHDLGCIYAGVSHARRRRAPIPTREFPE